MPPVTSVETVVALGIVLMLLGGLALLSALFVSQGSAELLGMELSALTIFVIGFVAGLFVLWGFSLTKWGTRRGLAAGRERRQLRKESQAHEQSQAHEPTRVRDEDR